jgi:sortase A
MLAVLTVAVARTPPVQASAPTVVAVSELPAPGEPVGTLTISRIRLDTVFYEGFSDKTLKKGPGRKRNGALPGEPGNMVIAGHRTSHTAPFRRLNKVRKGDLITTSWAGVTYTYKVTSVRILRGAAVSFIDKNTAGPTLTLFSCHPPHSTTHRVVIKAKWLSKA